MQIASLRHEMLDFNGDARQRHVRDHVSLLLGLPFRSQLGTRRAIERDQRWVPGEFFKTSIGDLDLA